MSLVNGASREYQSALEASLFHGRHPGRWKPEHKHVGIIFFPTPCLHRQYTRRSKYSNESGVPGYTLGSRNHGEVLSLTRRLWESMFQRFPKDTHQTVWGKGLVVQNILSSILLTPASRLKELQLQAEFLFYQAKRA